MHVSTLRVEKLLSVFCAHLPCSSMPAIIPQLKHSLLQSLLSIHSEVTEFLGFEQCVKFIELVQILKPTITLLLLPDERGPPKHLSRPIHEFLSISAMMLQIVMSMGFKTHVGL